MTQPTDIQPLTLPTPSGARWEWDMYDDDGPHARACTRIRGKEICIVWKLGAPTVTAFLQRPSDQFPSIDIVPIPLLAQWLRKAIQS